MSPPDHSENPPSYQASTSSPPSVEISTRGRGFPTNFQWRTYGTLPQVSRSRSSPCKGSCNILKSIIGALVFLVVWHYIYFEYVRHQHQVFLDNWENERRAYEAETEVWNARRNAYIREKQGWETERKGHIREQKGWEVERKVHAPYFEEPVLKVCPVWHITQGSIELLILHNYLLMDQY
ncbi:uncharacterized protein STEHIDRAFT_123754 [Stereum hirsutum FP-91666 SS1]|uniref:uncharacterized protein n=1 Tax=Stereum hirsutum (strain FP-91666) TaxID=721885 RepID=UPI0004449332|nr:uncharacterized protein STEHIDRAFT_123754 [Stereum hirsutum FP-91666 SS1]EIM83315.1 hypothetical protein STEHIDRAFT_123754 [Stereum hirsutum FP-91666 SS1]